MKPTQFGPGGIPGPVANAISTGPGVEFTNTPSPGDVPIADGDGTAHWGSPTAAGSTGSGQLLIADDHATPLVFDDILQTDAGDDFLYADG